MNKKKTLVNFILDKSGSMLSVKTPTMNGFNEYIQELRKKEDDFSFSLTLFDTSVETVSSNIPLKKAKELDADSYKPDGGTALYDAVCETVERVERTMEQDQKSLVVIMTDGEENSSKKYNLDQLKFLIEHLQRTERWTFVFLGANQDSWMKAKSFGIPAFNASNFVSNDRGIKTAFTMMAHNTMNFADSGSSSTSDFFSKNDQDKMGSGN